MQILSVQYLRGLAASAVVLFHAGLIYNLNFGLGNAGVDIFFVISGLIMWIVSNQKNDTPKQFIIQRTIRIVPLYWSVTIFLTIAAAARPNLFPLERPAPWHVLQSLLFIPHVAPNGKVHPILIQGWTLNYEMFFYSLFALILFLPVRFRLIGFTALIGSLVLLGSAVAPTNTLAATYTSPLLIEFLVGIWLGKALTSAKLPSRGGASTLLISGVFMLFCSHWLENLTQERLLIWGLPAACIVAGSIALEQRGLVPTIPVLKFLGDASYSIYLAHSFGFLGVAIIVEKLGLAGQGTGNFLVTTVGGFAAGILCFLLVERPITSFIRKIRSGPHRSVQRMA
ncbi:acyltransferase [Microvirga sp. BSC39]|uniref:acyltransferase family protein n=1 Tax=Microvirga sp. BSC39 TaxID=1549810 RepID=UPI0004E975A8|nr:acyltransferase [Microvirga sp. BSC39]KFG70797.1 hypothetical protein JH26_02265 [Microvirga sp. BSC39]